MKTRITTLLLSLSPWLFFSPAFAEATKEIAGTVSLAKGAEKNINSTGVLFVFAKNAGGKAGDGAPPVAVLKIPQPKFPVTFKISAQNLMIPGSAFEGPFDVYARYSPSGDAIDKTGPEGSTASKTPIKVGQADLKIELKAK